MPCHPNRTRSGGLPEYRGARCAQAVDQDPDGAVYVAPAWLVGCGKSTPVISLHVTMRDGRVELGVDDAHDVREALERSLKWIEESEQRD